MGNNICVMSNMANMADMKVNMNDLMRNMIGLLGNIG